MASNANWFGAYARWAGLSDGDAIDTERRNKVVARMKEHLDAAMPRASDVLSDRAPGFLLDLCSALYAIDHGKPFQVETVRTLARALEDSPCKVVAAGYLDRGSLSDAARVARKAKDYCMSDHLRNLLAAVEAERNRVRYQNQKVLTRWRVDVGLKRPDLRLALARIYLVGGAS